MCCVKRPTIYSEHVMSAYEEQHGYKVTVRLSKQEKQLLEKIALVNGIHLSDIVKILLHRYVNHIVTYIGNTTVDTTDNITKEIQDEFNELNDKIETKFLTITNHG